MKLKKELSVCATILRGECDCSQVSSPSGGAHGHQSDHYVAGFQPRVRASQHTLHLSWKISLVGWARQQLTGVAVDGGNFTAYGFQSENRMSGGQTFRWGTTCPAIAFAYRWDENSGFCLHLAIIPKRIIWVGGLLTTHYMSIFCLFPQAGLLAMSPFEMSRSDVCIYLDFGNHYFQLLL